jgi:protein-L-isoaspartate(D-aspartate) O-methyltransferase
MIGIIKMQRIVIIILILMVSYALIFAQEAVTQASPNLDFKNLRERMVTYQIEQRGVKDRRVLEAIRKVERHKFVPLALQHLAYEDTPLPIDEEQTISQPYIVALMTELLQLKGKEKVLEIGTGSGYQAAILAELAKDVYTIEILPRLADRAKELVSELGYKNIQVKCGDGNFGWPEFAPFDAIIVTCAAKEIPPPLIEQLAEGGRMVIPQGEVHQVLKLLVKVKGRIEQSDIIPVRFVPMRKNGAHPRLRRGVPWAKCPSGHNLSAPPTAGRFYGRGV